MGRVSQSETTWHEQRDKWAKIWFEKLCRFHGRKPQVTWEFTADDVIAFLRDHVRRKTPAWKRLKIIQSLICYRRYVQAAPFDDLKFIQTKLEDLTRAEKIKEARLREAGGHTADEIEDVVGHIDPSEPDILQNLRRAVRARQDTLETERAYVANVKAFMRERGLKRQADFAEIHAADVEAHLTDLAVDGNVAPSTQNRAFYALLYVFQHVLKREMGEVQAIRSTKGKQIPTVLSVDEIEQIFAHLHGVHLLIAKLLYGCGMRISEALRLRMKDFDFDRMVIEVHASKGGKSRIVPMPASVVPEMDGVSSRATRTRSRTRPGVGVFAEGTGAEVSRCCTRIEVAIFVCIPPPVTRSTNPSAATSSLAQRYVPSELACGGQEGGDSQACQFACVSSQLCHASAA